MDNHYKLVSLIEKYKANSIADDELLELFTLLSNEENADFLENKVLSDLENDQVPGADLPPHIAQEIMRNILNAENNVVQLLPKKISRLKKWSWAIAASLLLCVAAYVLHFMADTGFKSKSFYGSLTAKNLIVKQNTTNKPLTVLLPDGSHVTLEPNSLIRYDAAFGQEERKSFLEGDAFFDVRKNPQIPFFVYSGLLVTKVLGTSFDIRTDKLSGDVEVIVKTGRVQVFENEELIRNPQKKAGVFITPNQKTIYSVKSRQFETLLVEDPQPLMERKKLPALINSNPQNFFFDKEKLSGLLIKFEDYYGIELILENENLNNCFFTGDLTGKDFYTSLQIICLTINATYEVYGTKVLIKGKGCTNIYN